MEIKKLQTRIISTSPSEHSSFIQQGAQVVSDQYLYDSAQYFQHIFCSFFSYT